VEEVATVVRPLVGRSQRTAGCCHWDQQSWEIMAPLTVVTLWKEELDVLTEDLQFTWPLRPLPIGGDAGECPDGAFATNSTVATQDGGRGEVECNGEVQNFERLFESTTIIAEPEAHRNSKQRPDSSQFISITPSSAAEADRLQMELEKMESEAEEMNNGDDYSPTDDGIGDGARCDQPAPAATMAPQPIYNEEIMKSAKSKEFKDIQSGNNKEENYESFVLPSSDAEFAKYQGEVGLEKLRSDERSEVRSRENSKETIEKYGDWRNGDIESDDSANRKEVLYNHIQTARSQTEFRSLPRRPTRSSVRPSLFRDEAFETQFQPMRKKRLRRVCLHPGRGEFRGCSSVDGVRDLTQVPRKEQKYFRFGRGDQEAVKQGVSKQNEQISSSLNWSNAKALFQGLKTASCKDRYCCDRNMGLSRRIGPNRQSKIRFKRYKWRTWRIREESEKRRIALDHQYWCQTENSDTQPTEVLSANHHCRGEEDEGRRSRTRRLIHSTSFEPVSSSYRRRTMVCRPLIRTGCYGSNRRLKMNRPSLLSHESETGFISRKLNHGEFRLDKLSRPTRFRPRKGVYSKRKLRQRQPGFSKRRN